MLGSLSRVATVIVLTLISVVAGAATWSASAAYQPTARASWVPNGTVFAMAKAGNTVYLGGTFTSFTNPANGAVVARSRLAAVDATTGALITSWDPGADNTVRALAVGADGTVYAGGAFTTAAGAPAGRLAAITPYGTAVSGWAAAANDTVRDIVADSTGLYVAGAFRTVNGMTRARVARVAPETGAVDTSFNARVVGGAVYTIVPVDGSLLLGGSFTSLSTAPRVFSGSVTLSSGAVTNWAPASQCDTCWVLDLATDGINAYQGIGGPGGRATAFDARTGARVWSQYGDGDVQAVAVQDGVIYAGGHFTTFLSLPRHQLVPLNASTGAPQSYTIGFTGADYPGVWSIIADATDLRLGGAFRLANNRAARYATFATS